MVAVIADRDRPQPVVVPIGGWIGPAVVPANRNPTARGPPRHLSRAGLGPTLCSAAVTFSPAAAQGGQAIHVPGPARTVLPTGLWLGEGASQSGLGLSGIPPGNLGNPHIPAAGSTQHFCRMSVLPNERGVHFW